MSAAIAAQPWVMKNITAKPRRGGPKTVRTAPYGAFGLRGKATLGYANARKPRIGCTQGSYRAVPSARSGPKQKS